MHDVPALVADWRQRCSGCRGRSLAYFAHYYFQPRITSYNTNSRILSVPHRKIAMTSTKPNTTAGDLRRFFAGRPDDLLRLRARIPWRKRGNRCPVAEVHEQQRRQHQTSHQCARARTRLACSASQIKTRRRLQYAAIRQRNLELVARGADGLHGLIRHNYFTFGALAPESVAGAEGIEPPTFGFGDRRSAN